MKEAHCFYNVFFNFTRADDIIFHKEVGGHSNQGLLGPATEPVHGATRYQAREFQRTGTELLTNLKRAKSKSIRSAEGLSVSERGVGAC